MNVGLAEESNGCGARISPVPLLYVIPLVPVKCARTSDALGPVYVRTPVELL